MCTGSGETARDLDFMLVDETARVQGDQHEARPLPEGDAESHEGQEGDEVIDVVQALGFSSDVVLCSLSDAHR